MVAVSGSVGGLGLVLSGYGSVVVSVLVLVLVQELVSCALPVQELAVERRLAPFEFVFEEELARELELELGQDRELSGS